MKNTIVVPTDFTGFCEVAIRQAIAFARIYNAEIEFLHIVEKPSEKEAEERMEELVTAVRLANEIQCKGRVLHGTMAEVLDNATCESEQYCLMILASATVHGSSQTIHGKDVLKLASHIHIPVLVVQQDCALIENITTIILPVASHTSFHKAVDAVTLLAWPDATEIHLYSIFKPGFDWPEQLVKNIDEAIKYLENHQMKVLRVKEDQKVYSPGYGKQTLNYAGSVGADLICIMSEASEEYYFMAQADKETILNNDQKLAVLLA